LTIQSWRLLGSSIPFHVDNTEAFNQLSAETAHLFLFFVPFKLDIFDTSETGFAAIYLTMRNDDDSPSTVPSIRLIDSDAREYDTSPKALLKEMRSI
jgi:hypothetical protein